MVFFRGFLALWQKTLCGLAPSGVPISGHFRMTLPRGDPVRLQILCRRRNENLPHAFHHFAPAELRVMLPQGGSLTAIRRAPKPARQAHSPEMEIHSRHGRARTGSRFQARRNPYPLHIPGTTKPDVVVPVLRFVPVTIRRAQV